MSLLSGEVLSIVLGPSATGRPFGASLMRLRKQRRLRRSDFAPISSKEIARLERNEVAAPHGKTLETIAKRLEVRIEEITDF